MLTQQLADIFSIPLVRTTPNQPLEEYEEPIYLNGSIRSILYGDDDDDTTPLEHRCDATPHRNAEALSFLLVWEEVSNNDNNDNIRGWSRTQRRQGRRHQERRLRARTWMVRARSDVDDASSYLHDKFVSKTKRTNKRYYECNRMLIHLSSYIGTDSCTPAFVKAGWSEWHSINDVGCCNSCERPSLCRRQHDREQHCPSKDIYYSPRSRKSIVHRQISIVHRQGCDDCDCDSVPIVSLHYR